MAYWNGDHHTSSYDAHLDRLRNGSTQMGLGFPWSNEDLILGIVSLLDEVPNNYYIRPIVLPFSATTQL